MPHWRPPRYAHASDTCTLFYHPTLTVFPALISVCTHAWCALSTLTPHFHLHAVGRSINPFADVALGGGGNQPPPGPPPPPSFLQMVSEAAGNGNGGSPMGGGGQRRATEPGAMPGQQLQQQQAGGGGMMLAAAGQQRGMAGGGGGAFISAGGAYGQQQQQPQAGGGAFSAGGAYGQQQQSKRPLETTASGQMGGCSEEGGGRRLWSGREGEVVDWPDGYSGGGGGVLFGGRRDRGLFWGLKGHQGSCLPSTLHLHYVHTYFPAISPVQLTTHAGTSPSHPR